MGNRLTHIFVWLSRITHCRGFGVQSPTDYAFVCSVINERMPYYQYDEVGQGDGWLVRRLGLLYFRLANWCQPVQAFVPACYRAYVKAGCKKVALSDSISGDTALAIVQTPEEAEQVLSSADSCTLLVLDGLYRHKSLWQQIMAHPRVTVCFDLYYCGIALFDPKRTKQHYIINF